MKRKNAETEREKLEALAEGMTKNETLPDIAARLGMTAEDARDLIFAAHRSGEWGRIVRETRISK